VLLTAAAPAALAAQEAAESVLVRENIGEDFYAAGNKVVLEGDVSGDAVLAGGTVLVTGAVSEDVIAAGGTVTILGDVGDDLRLAGGQVTLAASVADHAVISGGEVEVGENATINSWAWLAGGEVEMNGWVTGDLKIAAGEAEIGGRVDGNVEIAAREIEIEDGAVINGDLIWRGEEEPEIADGAEITGEVIEGEPIEGLDFERGDDGSGLFGLLSMIFCAGLFYTVFSTRLDRLFSDFVSQPGRNLLLGLGVMVITPVLAALFFATAIGWLLGLLVFAGYGLIVITGALSGISLTARWGLDRFRQMPDPSLGMVWLAIAALAVVISILYWLPLLGGVAATAILLLGVGTVAGELYREVREKAAA
jgi:cytoskeletal protein CcmA (bactofilin family)